MADELSLDAAERSDLRLLRSDGIGYDGSTRAERLLRADRRVARGLIFDLGVEFDTEERRTRVRRIRDRLSLAFQGDFDEQPIERRAEHDRG